MSIDHVNVHYYEAAVLCCPSAPPTRTPTLDDYHQAAWRVFAGTTHYSVGQRPFVFSFESLTPEQHLLIVRSSMEFPHAQKKHITLRQGDNIRLEWSWVPSIATRLSPTGERLTRSKHIPAPREQWEALLCQRLGNHGFAVAPNTLRCTPLGQWPMNAQRSRWYQRVHVQADLHIEDTQKAAQAWLSGVSRLKAYGMGMLCRRE